ncbi:MAG: aminotransferase class I/II-fold pyridoxal phosphate-dependent enzyme [Clostridia bacterium]|nr:aminotransferase class I/II-fold pyridoxal phosphate-dependent enzyme [Clostridia bacterium]
MKYCLMTKEQLVKEKEQLLISYDNLKSKHLKLDMSRGKPNSDQLDITAKVFKNIDCYSKRIYKDNFDIGNYGLFSGITEAKELFAELLDGNPEDIIIGGNSSLNLMYDMFSQLMMSGNQDSVRPWCKEEKIRFLCPSPGYDRHFAICEHFNIEMITIPMNEDGPDMDMVEAAVKDDDTVKGIWCVPVYSNPDGYSYKATTLERLAKMQTKAKDFRIFWDNAYFVHHLYSDKKDEIENMLSLCRQYHNDDRVYMFASTSKISFPGAGISAICTSKSNIQNIMDRMKIQTIGYDKINMLRHVIAFKDRDGVIKHMEKLAEVLRPKFEIVINTLDKEIKPLDIARWNTPLGGYFISFYAMEGCAKKIIELCKEAGVVLTSAGATYPYGKDPSDSNIRLAPTYPSDNELEQAIEVFVVCVKLATVIKMLGEIK